MLDPLAVAATAAEASSAWSMFDSTATIVGFIAAVLSGLGWLFTWFRLRGVTRAQGELEQLRSKLLLNYDAALKENAALAKQRNDWMPTAWLAEADKERTAGNDAKAIGILDAGYQRVREDLGIVVHQLAEYHTSRMIGFDANFEHESARRLARVAKGLAPERREIAELANDLEDIEILDGEPLQLANSRFDASNQEEAERVISAALRLNERMKLERRSHASLLLSRRAKRLVTRHGLDESWIGRAAMFNFAHALVSNRRGEEALAEVDTLLPQMERARGLGHRETLATRHLKAEILSSLDQNEAALSLVNSVLSEWKQAQDSTSDDVLDSQYLKAKILSNLGQNEEALRTVNILLPAMQRAKGNQHPDVMSTLYLQIQALSRLGRHEEALAAVKALLPVRKAAQGSAHPDVLTTHNILAQILGDLGRNEEAIAVIDKLLPIREREQGIDHPGTIATRLLKSQILEKFDHI